jgi:hypothetical protein
LGWKDIVMLDILENIEMLNEIIESTNPVETAKKYKNLMELRADKEEKRMREFMYTEDMYNE